MFGASFQQLLQRPLFLSDSVAPLFCFPSSKMSFLRSKSRRPSAGPAVAADVAPEIAPAGAASAPVPAPPPTTTTMDAAAIAAAAGSGNGKTAAVVGSGISGLATAWLLQQ